MTNKQRQRIVAHRNFMEDERFKAKEKKLEEERLDIALKEFISKNGEVKCSGLLLQ